MENPRLTFLTPSVLAGDRSLVAVVAHELAHSWTGNLISNANAEHFWLNEGGATYAERRIVEALWGPDTAALDWALGRRELEEALQRLVDTGRQELSRLRTELLGIDPDDAYTVVPYEKGALLFRALEVNAGRAAFDAFIREYIETFRFGVLTTEQFLPFIEAHLAAGAIRLTNPREWLYAAGLPESAPEPRSDRLDAITALNGQAPSDEQAAPWSAIEWQLYLESVPRTTPTTALADLDRRFSLTATRNYDVLEKWLVVAIRADYRPTFPRLEEVLATMGRMKYLRSLYRSLNQLDPAFARRLFETNAAHYHPIARQVVASELGVDPR
jgi:leukotriene-A4 hydrolase